MRSKRDTQRGVTLLEVAIVVLVIGLLLGAVLKGQELITAARVRSVVSELDGFRAAFFGFVDRYGSPPGDYAKANVTITGITDATATCGLASPDRGNGNGNGIIDLANGEFILAWEHLSRSGFVNSTYRCVDNTTVNASTTPTNMYSQFFQLVYDNNFTGSNTASRHNLKTGNQMPSYLLSEVDRKIDDANALTGSFRGSTYTTGAAVDATCWDANGVWSTSTQNCSAARLF